MVAGIGETLAKAIRGEGNELGFRVDEVHLLSSGLLSVSIRLLAEATKAAKTTKALTGLGGILLGLYAVQNALCFCLVVNARLITPAIGGKNQCSNEVELSVAGGTVGITGAVSFATPGKITLAYAALVLHILTRPAPQTVKDILLSKLYGNHHAIRHTLSTGIMVLDIRNIAHGVSYFKVHFIGTTEYIVKNFLYFRVNVGRLIAHLYKDITVLTCFKASLCPRG